MCLESCDTFVALTPSVHFVLKLDNLSQSQAVCPMRAFSCTESDTSHSVILLLPWILLYSLSQSQTVCLITSPKASLVLHTVYHCLAHAHPAWETCLEFLTFVALTPSVQSVLKSDSLSKKCSLSDGVLLFLQSARRMHNGSMTSCNRARNVTSAGPLWDSCSIDLHARTSEII